eukprot:CAMPEP_0172546884 /NCGR_PEP_ID=MMETSP1067-20121228/16545_1 /TAXON_ID=265564 ORGANISM="Thalassiosira punctigera, Strain Tpunct2005C2" /NCGR_SAMPLE_ID=MMETSP1067 /ASSEMBLY_ACC=CAM_ASM_000444 /LENGTH=106 /DNA_ID=CAMNT_0013333877 /DNA_START=89 /DNA_END=409 /DNA_ORIENTATION=-
MAPEAVWLVQPQGHGSSGQSSCWQQRDQAECSAVGLPLFGRKYALAGVDSNLGLLLHWTLSAFADLDEAMEVEFSLSLMNSDMPEVFNDDTMVSCAAQLIGAMFFA